MRPHALTRVVRRIALSTPNLDESVVDPLQLPSV